MYNTQNHVQCNAIILQEILTYLIYYSNTTKGRKLTKREWFTFSPLALLMARRGLSTRSTRRILTTEIALELRATKQKDLESNKQSLKIREYKV